MKNRNIFKSKVAFPKTRTANRRFEGSKVLEKPLLLFFIISGIFICSCATNNNGILYSVVECPKSIREKVVYYAQEYVKRDTYFSMGGRDLLEQEGDLALDCSGIIVRAYQYAVKDSMYDLLFEDTNVSSFYYYFTNKIDMPEPGDLIFMGYNYPTHMSIFFDMDDEYIYFIDATLKEDDGFDGVNLRFYKKDDNRFLTFGRLLVKI